MLLPLASIGAGALEDIELEVPELLVLVISESLEGCNVCIYVCMYVYMHVRMYDIEVEVPELLVLVISESLKGCNVYICVCVCVCL